MGLGKFKEPNTTNLSSAGVLNVAGVREPKYYVTSLKFNHL